MTESIAELREVLSRAGDDRERAELHDALATRLAHEHRLDDALAESTRAVALWDALARSDPGMLPHLTVGLSNLGQHLSALERYRDAIVAHVRALELLVQVGPSETGSLARMGYNASRLGILLFELKQPSLAARFDGLALAVYLVLKETKADYAVSAARQVNSLCLSLDAAASVPAGEETSTKLDVERLSAAGTPSLRAAGYLGQWAAAMSYQGDVELAVVLARRVVAYCNLFPERHEDRAFSALREENLRRTANWSAALRPRVSTQSARPEPDRRLWSITGQQLSYLVGELVRRGVASTDVYALGKRLVNSGLYPARDCAYRCNARPPHVFITYTWSTNFVDLQVGIRNALSFVGELVRLARPELDNSVVEHLVHEKLGLWIDFVFIDQSGRHLAEEVREVLPQVIAASDVHFVIAQSAMIRSWCCYEVALFNQRKASELSLGPSGQPDIRSFVGGSSSNYRTFGQTETSQPEDKRTIEQAIVELFPGGMSAFDALLIQASMISDPFVSPGFTQSQAAVALVRQSIDRWLTL